MSSRRRERTAVGSTNRSLGSLEVARSPMRSNNNSGLADPGSSRAAAVPKQEAGLLHSFTRGQTHEHVSMQDRGGHISPSQRERALASSARAQRAQRAHVQDRVRSTSEGLRSRVLQNHSNFRDMFRSFDVSFTGQVSLRDVRKVTKALALPFSDDDLKRTFKAVDKNGSGQIAFSEFCDMFEPEKFGEYKYEPLSPRSGGHMGVLNGALGKLQRATKLQESNERIFLNAIRHFDPIGDGRVTREQFVECMREIRLPVTDAGMADLLNTVDPGREGVVKYTDVVNELQQHPQLTQLDDGAGKLLMDPVRSMERLQRAANAPPASELYQSLPGHLQDDETAADRQRDFTTQHHRDFGHSPTARQSRSARMRGAAKAQSAVAAATAAEQEAALAANAVKRSARAALLTRRLTDHIGGEGEDESGGSSGGGGGGGGAEGGANYAYDYQGAAAHYAAADRAPRSSVRSANRGAGGALTPGSRRAAAAAAAGALAMLSPGALHGGSPGFGGMGSGRSESSNSSSARRLNDMFAAASTGHRPAGGTRSGATPDWVYGPTAGRAGMQIARDTGMYASPTQRFTTTSDALPHDDGPRDARLERKHADEEARHARRRGHETRITEHYAQDELKRRLEEDARIKSRSKQTLNYMTQVNTRDQRLYNLKGDDGSGNKKHFAGVKSQSHMKDMGNYNDNH